MSQGWRSYGPSRDGPVSETNVAGRAEVELRRIARRQEEIVLTRRGRVLVWLLRRSGSG